VIDVRVFNADGVGTIRAPWDQKSELERVRKGLAISSAF